MFIGREKGSFWGGVLLWNRGLPWAWDNLPASFCWVLGLQIWVKDSNSSPLPHKVLFCNSVLVLDSWQLSPVSASQSSYRLSLSFSAQGVKGGPCTCWIGTLLRYIYTSFYNFIWRQSLTKFPRLTLKPFLSRVSTWEIVITIIYY